MTWNMYLAPQELFDSCCCMLEVVVVKLFFGHSFGVSYVFVPRL